VGRATYEDLLQVPDHFVAEILEGELYANPRPATPHGRATTKLNIILGPEFDHRRSDGWLFMFEPELHLGEDVMVPDIAAWRRSRMPVTPNVPWLDLAPDWICEALSPSTQRLDRFKKMPAYARENVQYAWILDANLQSLEAFRLENGRWSNIAQHLGDAVVRVEPFESIEIKLADLWD